MDEMAAKTVILQWHHGEAVITGTIILQNLRNEFETECDQIQFNQAALTEFLSKAF